MTADVAAVNPRDNSLTLPMAHGSVRQAPAFATGAEPVRLTIPARTCPLCSVLRTLNDCGAIIRAAAAPNARS